jgi:hypothetical protein
VQQNKNVEVSVWRLLQQTVRDYYSATTVKCLVDNTIICLEINTTICLEVNYNNVRTDYYNNLFGVFYSNLLRHCQDIWNR